MGVKTDKHKLWRFKMYFSYLLNIMVLFWRFLREPFSPIDLEKRNLTSSVTVCTFLLLLLFQFLELLQTNAWLFSDNCAINRDADCICTRSILNPPKHRKRSYGKMWQVFWHLQWVYLTCTRKKKKKSGMFCWIS